MATFSLKVIKATMCQQGKRKPDFQPISQTYLDLVETTANLEHILSVIQRRWGSEYTIVTNDGLPLEHSPSTQGLAFWKCPRRKVYAVSEKDIAESTTIPSWKRPIHVDSDDEDFLLKSKKGRREDKLDLLLGEVGGIKEMVGEMMTLTSDSNIPIGLKRILRETFKCRICHTMPIKPPVIMTKCCKTILGCESCINNWYSGKDALTKNCPSCRAPRGYNETMLLRGLDDFLIEVRKAIQTEDERDE